MLSCLSLLLAVTTLAQDAPRAPAKAEGRRHRTPPVAADIYDLTMPSAALTDAAQALAAAQMNVTALTAPVADIQAFTMAAPALAMSAAQLQIAAVPFAMGPDGIVWSDDDVEEPAWPRFEQNPQQKDPADSLYRAAQDALNGQQFSRAATMFRDIRSRYPKSVYVGNSFYWQAFALYRVGSDDALRNARQALQTQQSRYPKATTRRDADVLLRRVQGELARRGDADAAQSISAEAESLAPEAAPAIAAVPATPGAPPAALIGPPTISRGRGRDDDCDDEDDVRIAALNGLLQMDADRAVPILKSVLARRDTSSTCLRRKAVFLVSQKRSAETSAILLNAVRSDPDQEVREQAVFWLSQVPGDETVAALDSILQDPKSDPEIQEKAIFALSQHRSPRAAQILCTYSGRRDRPSDLREKSIFWLGQRRSDDNQQCLRNLYKNLDTDDLKEKVIFSLSQSGGADNYRWLMDIALNDKENIELRKKALFWAGQGRNVDIADLVKLYDSMKDPEMKEQLIFVYSQRRDDAAVEKLCLIGKNDPDRELRKKAVFWLGQSRSERASQCLQDLINQ